jgi:ADP-ribose pyrophosphatase
MAEALEAHPSRCMVVGDMPVDVETARAAGAVPVGASWGMRPVRELFGAGARLLLHRPLDLLSWVPRAAPDKASGTYPLHARAAVGAVVFHRDRVLLVKRAKPPAPELWAIPGGSVRLGESLQAAAEREILEETGVTICAGEPVFTFDAVEHDAEGAVRFHYVIVDLEAEYVAGVPRAGDDARDARWVGRDELEHLPIHHRTLRLLAERFGFEG